MRPFLKIIQADEADGRAGELLIGLHVHLGNAEVFRHNQMVGFIALQGGRQAAQKSTSTGSWESMTSCFQLNFLRSI